MTERRRRLRKLRNQQTAPSAAAMNVASMLLRPTQKKRAAIKQRIETAIHARSIIVFLFSNAAPLRFARPKLASNLFDVDLNDGFNGARRIAGLIIAGLRAQFAA